MNNWVSKGLNHLGDDGEVVSVQLVSGGDINEAYFIQTENHEFFVKRNIEADIAFFDFEAQGLKKIKSTNTIEVPDVYGVYEESGIPMLWLEWIKRTKYKKTEDLLGEQLASLHLCEGSGYGFEENGFIGKLKQKNNVLDDWITYYRDYRLYNQLEQGGLQGTIYGKRERRLFAVMDKLDQWIPNNPKQSILHGDLWGGNWLTGPNGVPYLIDPSILYGDHEMEIAFTELFGGFSNQFYGAYNSVFRLSDEYTDRKELYQLYYLLVHLNMFGEAYGSAVDRILIRYVG
ncbi:fructosamine kinase family protein [Oceanobacillus salinisoli]|uniref:fructosamine kinase family protein n=1 Tax=Oceanobacillus salinisoli TaxID=2678611 RepID=UPI0012E29865|nr:fructosamine kinase family protein [Oceanobacillus salinisoli]